MTRASGTATSAQALAAPVRRPLIRDRMLQRLVRLVIGLVLFGTSMAMMVRARLGVGPWDVLHQGLSLRTPLSFGTIVIIVSVVVLLLWIPLRERPGLGTLLNTIVIGLVADAVLSVLVAPASLGWRWVMMLAAVVVNGIGTGLYIGAGLGPGPRDGLMTGLAARGHSIFAVRTGIEVVVLAAGWLLGGTVGVGTVAYALGIGPLAHLLLPLLSVRDRPAVGLAGPSGS